MKIVEKGVSAIHLEIAAHFQNTNYKAKRIYYFFDDFLAQFTKMSYICGINAPQWRTNTLILL